MWLAEGLWPGAGAEVPRLRLAALAAATAAAAAAAVEVVVKNMPLLLLG
jgi:hypothetical protein